MTCKCEADNSRYKLLGFDNHKSRVIVMVVATGKVIKVKLSELISSEVMDNFNPAEVKTIHKKGGCRS